MYNNIASNPDVRVYCGQPNANIDVCNTCRDTGFDAFENFVDPAWSAANNLNHDQYITETQTCGFQEGHNIVVCDKSFAGGFQPLTSYEPQAGQNLECAKSTWGAMMVHELSHVFGTRDGGDVYAYGFDAAHQIAEAGGARGITPLGFADTFSLFALGSQLLPLQ
ncbi:MAG: hypothetical protein OHK93_006638 [Ramalina farinacea]|uniref:Lysine-specific metallo-endopeptidase domain-containing protein n=1 Tax=Ramalina farinacea TaxID=258253 RepID=A0AA43QL86_9LECA|nr:hypothetical protein [Ramalina farinacea]